MGLQVIGAGFGRTGTLSLQTALKRLGFDPCYHMVEVFPRGPGEFRKWEQVAEGKPDWDSIFGNYKATVDFPACNYWRELADYYPQAKVILSLRDPEKWFQSTQDTIFAPHWIEYLPTSSAGKFMDGAVNDYFDHRMHDREHLIACFNRHVAEVQAGIAPARLLTFEARQGWEPLCEFLGTPIPDEPYPHINDTEATKNVINAIVERGFDGVFG